MGLTVNSVKCEPVEDSAICGGSKNTDQIVIKTIINVTVTAGTSENDRKITPMLYENRGMSDFWIDEIIDNKKLQTAPDDKSNHDLTFETRIICKQNCSMDGPNYTGGDKPPWTSRGEKTADIYSYENKTKTSSAVHTISCVLSKDPEDLDPGKQQVKEKPPSD